jgi:hypothetical protein
MELLDKIKARDLFDSLDSEKPQPQEKKLEVAGTSTLEKIVRKFNKQLERNWGSSLKGKSAAERHYFNAMKLLSTGFKDPITAGDVENFSVMLGGYGGISDRWDPIRNHAGIYLSALVDSSPEAEFTIQTKHLPGLVNNIAYKNTKQIVVNGNVGSIATKMTEGSLLVEGNAEYIGGEVLQSLQGGSVEVMGNVADKDDSHGYPLGCILIDGGEVKVHGNVNKGIWGYSFLRREDPINIYVLGNVHGKIRLQSGELHVWGDYDSVDLRYRDSQLDYQYFKMFHKGKLIVSHDELNVPREKRRCAT